MLAAQRIPTQERFVIRPQVEKIMDSGKIERREYSHLTSAILADYQLTDEERRLINRVFDAIQIGRVQIEPMR
jgi:hypothetical protein